MWQQNLNNALDIFSHCRLPSLRSEMNYLLHEWKIFEAYFKMLFVVLRCSYIVRPRQDNFRRWHGCMVVSSRVESGAARLSVQEARDEITFFINPGTRISGRMNGKL